MNPLAVTRKPFFGKLGAVLLKKALKQGPGMPGIGQTMPDAALQRMILGGVSPRAATGIKSGLPRGDGL